MRAVRLFPVIAAITVTLIGPACKDDGTAMSGDHSGPAMNFHAISDRLATGGHFVGDGLQQLSDSGVQVVIDLRDEPPAGQKERLAGHGIEWVSVPVSWENPRPADFVRFKAAMVAHQGNRVFVQCAANYRASAMTYLYQILVEGIPEEKALQSLHAVWKPNETWSDYIDAVRMRAVSE